LTQGLFEAGSTTKNGVQLDGYHFGQGSGGLFVKVDLDTGFRTCTVSLSSEPNMKVGFVRWAESARVSNRYVEAEPDVWHSTGWADPSLVVVGVDDAATITEESLEN